MSSIIGLSGETLLDMSPVAQARRDIKRIIEILPDMQRQAYINRLLFGPFEFHTYRKGQFAIEYSFELHEATPQIMAIFKDDAIYSHEFMELLMASIARTNIDRLALRDFGLKPMTDTEKEIASAKFAREQMGEITTGFPAGKVVGISSDGPIFADDHVRMGPLDKFDSASIENGKLEVKSSPIIFGG